MTKSNKTFILAMSTALLLTIWWTGSARHGEEIIYSDEATTSITRMEAKKESEKKVQGKLEIQTINRELWLADLISCESRGNPEAINPKDRDGTPSYGLLQFKPSTFEMFAKAYKIEGELMDPEAQKKIVRGMMDDESVIWENQFPDCVKKLGRPPQE